MNYAVLNFNYIELIIALAGEDDENEEGDTILSFTLFTDAVLSFAIDAATEDKEGMVCFFE